MIYKPLDRRWLWVIAVSVMTTLCWGTNPNGGLRVEVIATPNFIVDSNTSATAPKTPRSAYITAKIWNDGTTNLTNVSALIGTFGDGSNSTPGLYPQRSHPGLTGPLPGGQFALTHEGGSSGLSDATRYLGTIQPGQSVTVFWLVSYPLFDTTGKPVFGSGSDISDDLWLNYDVWASAGTGPSPLKADQTGKVTIRSAISASANKISPMTANQVPEEYKVLLNMYQPAWTNIAIDGSVGSGIDIKGVWYSMGNVGPGFDSDGDLIPDHDVFLQPVGDPSTFDAGAFRLIGTDVLLIIKLKSGGDLVLNVKDRLYLKDIPENTGVVGYVRYQFMPLKTSSFSQLSPYQLAASGTGVKYNSDFGAVLGTSLESTGSSSAAMTKSTTVTLASPGDTIPYSMTFTNNGTVSVGNPDEGSPLVIQDRIPAGTRYVAGSATSLTNIPPAGMGDYLILYSTNNAASWLTSEPATASDVTDIQWWLTAPLLPTQTGIVRFSVEVLNPYTQTPILQNTAGLSMGNAGSFVGSTANTTIQGNNFLSAQVWYDNGSGGGIFGNKVKEAGELGASNITVNLYYDSNTNGLRDAGDLFIGTASSDSSGSYTFTNLVDGAYLAILDLTDPDVPAGFTLSTPQLYALDLDIARTNASPAGSLTANFGLAAAMSMTKQMTSPGPAYEDRTISYAITVTNNMAGNGLGGGAPVEYTAWATNVVSADTGWTITTNALGATDGLYALASLTANPSDALVLSGFNFSGKTSSITRVRVAVPVEAVGDISTSSFKVTVASGATQVFVTNYVGNASLTNALLVWDVTTNRSWQWTDFTTNGMRITVLTTRSNPKPTGSFRLDSASFLVTSSETLGGASSLTTLNPVPVVDTFDTRLLRLTSTVPSYSSVVTNGTTGIITWNNVGPLYPGGGRTLAVNFVGLEPTNNTATVVTNTASITNAFFEGGRSANSIVSQAITNFLPTGMIGDYVWRDQNRDGTNNVTEYGLANVKVVLTPPATVDAGAGVGVPITNVTDSTGYYLFSGLISTGRYVVAVLTNTLPRNGVGVTNTWTEMAGTVNPTNMTVVTNMIPWATDGSDKRLRADFGYSWSGSTVSGYIWNDLNRSGTSTADSGEFGLTNVTVYLYTNILTAAIATNRTDSSGYYSFNGNYAGDYYVQVVTNTGPLSGGTTWFQTYPAHGTPVTNPVLVTVPVNGVTNASMSFFQTGIYAIGDTLFYDWDGNGSMNGPDEGLYNIPVNLYRDSNSNGVIDVGIDVLYATTNTTAAGKYVFTNYPAGNYLVFVNQSVSNFPPLYAMTRDPYGAKDGLSFLTLTNASNTNQNFGYQPLGTSTIGDSIWRDLNADGIRSGLQETGLSNVTVSLYVDLNGDGTFVLLTTTNTLSNGQYSFPNLPAGNYKVVVDTTSTNIPRDSLNVPYALTTTNSVSVTVPSTNSTFTVGFGFAPLGGVGGMIFADSNGNGTRDLNEGGITNVTVTLYRDLNGNGVYDDGVDVSYATTTTSTNGTYLFSALPSDDYVVVVTTNLTPLSGMNLTATPTSDGQPVTEAVSQYALTISPGVAFLGASFGYQPPGVIGETVWIDTNGDGIRDASERGLVNVALILSNSVTTVTNRTDVDGYYNFNGLADGTYWLSVDTNDLQFVGLQASVDADGTNTANVITSIVITNGHVFSIAGVVKTNADLSLNFSYQYSGNNELSGTVGMDGTAKNGFLGAGPSGVASDEVAFPGETVFMYMWRDANTDGVMDAGETTPLGSTVTDANGDYQFTGLPSTLGAGVNRYVVALSAPREHLLLTTATGTTPALSVVSTTNTVGENSSAYQVVAIAATITDIDFAYTDAWSYDFGDAPSSYGTLLSDLPEGARHRVLSTTNLYLGMGISVDTNGYPSATADLDSLDDGVLPSGIWQNGLSSGTVQVTVGKGTGWLVGYVDFNRDGTFDGANEMILSTNVTMTGGDGNGVYTWPVAVPANSILASSMTSLYARFRLFPSEPAFPEVAYSGLAENGEVEDYRWDMGAIHGMLWADANRNGLYDGGELPLENVRVFVDQNTNGLWEAGEPYALSETNGLYGIGGLPTGSFTICVETNTLAEGLYLTTPPGATNNQTTVTLATEGQVVSTANFGYATQPVQIGDLVWNDLDADGIQDAGEPGLTNVTVRLLDSGSNLLFTTITDVNGAYSFTNLDAATYLVEVVAPPQFVFTIQDTTSTNDIFDSDVDASGRTAPFTLTSGMTDLSRDAGLSRAARLYGYAFYDINTNLVRNARVDYPIANMTVTLWRASTQVASTLTAADGTGKYEFLNLLAGDYTLRFAGPTNLLETVPASSDPERNRAAIDGDGKIAIAVALTPGEGVDIATEPRNAGFIRAERPLSESVAIRAFMTAEGVLVEFTTSGEEDFGFITLWVWMDGGWVELGSTLAVGSGSNTYSFDAPGLAAGERYYFRAMDEVGYLYDLYGVEVTPFAMELQVMGRTGVRLSWTSVPDRWYAVYTTPALGDPWTLLDMVWAEDESSVLDVRIDPAEPQRFFKIEMFRDDVITEGGAQ